MMRKHSNRKKEFCNHKITGYLIQFFTNTCINFHHVYRVVIAHGFLPEELSDDELLLSDDDEDDESSEDDDEELSDSSACC